MMQKTTSVSIGGRSFICDQSAYEIIQKYLTRSEKKLLDNPDKDEIMSDIERSIADHLKESLKDEVVNEELAKKTIKAIGEVDSNEEENDTTKPEELSLTDGIKRLWRRVKNIEPDNSHRIVFGTSAGIAKEFNIDPLWIRLLFVVLTIAQGSGLIIYLLLSFVIYNKDKTAQTASELLKGAEKTIKSRPYEKFLRSIFRYIWILTRILTATVGLIIFMAGAIALLSALFLLITDPQRLNILGAFKDWLQFIWITSAGLSIVLPGFLIMILAMRWKRSQRSAGIIAFIWLGAIIIAVASSIANVPRLRTWAIDNKVRNNFVYVYTLDDKVIDTCYSITGGCANTNMYTYANNGVCSYYQYDYYLQDQYIIPASNWYSKWMPHTEVLKQPMTATKYCEQVEKVLAQYPTDKYTVLFSSRPLSQQSMWQIEENGINVMQPTYFFDYLVSSF